MNLTIRDATVDDASAVLEIYAPNVANTPITFDYEIPTVAFFEDKIATLLKTHAYLVAERDGALVGYAYASQYRSKAAYQFSAETTIYLHESTKRTGVGTKLYESLLERLTTKGFHIAIAAITVPNDASLALHRKMGFARVGKLCEIGRKFDTWHDVEFWQRTLSPET